ncbi:MAG: hypothetical protein HYZ75_06705 [Elusimicrobia bacterium]|nr:hypothetical protein [Elusimicrobiota bacterium]
MSSKLLLSACAAALLAAPPQAGEREAAEAQGLVPVAVDRRPTVELVKPGGLRFADPGSQPLVTGDRDFEPDTSGERMLAGRLKRRRDLRELVLRTVKGSGAPFVDLPTLLLSGARLKGRKVWTGGYPTDIVYDGSRPRFILHDAIHAGDEFPVAMGAVDGAARSAVENPGGDRAALALGMVALTKAGEPYLEAFRLVALGSPGLPCTLSFFVAHGPDVDPPSRELQRAAFLRAQRRLKAERGRLHVEVADLLLTPSEYSGREVSVLGIAKNAVASRANVRFALGNGEGAFNTIQVVTDRLGLERNAEIRRFQTPSALVAVRARVAKTSQGAYFLDAASVDYVTRARDLAELSP